MMGVLDDLRPEPTTTTTTTPWLYSPCRTLTSFPTIFQSSLLCARIPQFVIPILLRSSLTSSIHLNLLECSDITSLPPFPHSSSPHVPAISIFLILCMLLYPILHIIVSLLHLFCSSNILLHIWNQIFFSAPSFPKYANFSHHLPLNTGRKCGKTSTLKASCLRNLFHQDRR